MKRLFAAMTAALLMVSLVASVAIAAPNIKYLTFGTGTVTEGPSGTFTIANDASEYGGVYLNSRSQSGKPLASVDFSFTASGDIAGGAPRLTVPIDMDGNGSAEDYASIGANNCVDPTFVSTTSPTCQVFLNSNGVTGWANWDAFAAANPTWRVAPGWIPFIIADVAGTYVVSDIVLR